MLKQSRWLVEQAAIKEGGFTGLRPFKYGDKIGFRGLLRVDGIPNHQIVVEGLISRYPVDEPRVYLHPHPEEHHWIRAVDPPYLCYDREDRAWSPARSTFASCVAIAVRYLKEFS
jgi:hypothetical protein